MFGAMFLEEEYKRCLFITEMCDRLLEDFSEKLDNL